MKLAQVASLDEDAARGVLRDMRWGDENVACPKCGASSIHFYHQRIIFRCRKCKQDFTERSGSLFHAAKLSNRDLLFALAIFAGTKRGISSPHMASMLGVQQKVAWLLSHKMREAMAAEQAKVRLGGVVEIDGAIFGGYTYVQPMVRAGARKRILKGERKIVVVIRERGGRTVPIVVDKEIEASFAINRHVAPGATLCCDLAHAWDHLSDLYNLLRVNHAKWQFKDGVACTNYAESFFGQLRAMQLGVHGSINHGNLAAYAVEMAWRQDHRNLSAWERTKALGALVMKCPPSARWSGYWQNHKRSRWENVVYGPWNENGVRQGGKRLCLCCAREFFSYGNGNRLCGRCKRKAAA